MIILVDMDDVLEKLVVGWVQYLNERHGTNVRVEDVKDWNMGKAFPMLTHEETYAAADDEALWDYVRPMPGAAEVLRRLMDEGHEIYIVTASGYKTLRTKMEHVLFRYYPFLTWSQVILTERKQLICGDVLIDDGPHNLIGGSYRKILYDACHNRTFDEKSIGAVRVHGWEEVYDVIKRME